MGEIERGQGQGEDKGREKRGKVTLKNKTIYKFVLTILAQQFSGVHEHLSLHKGRWGAAHTRTGVLTVHIKDDNIIAP